MAAIMEWFKVNGYNLVYGSLRLDPPIHQLIFIKLLAMTSISRVTGTVCIADKVPYPMDVLATTIGVSEKELIDAIEYNCKPEQNRLRKNEWGGIEIINWAHYQSKSYLRVKKHREKLRCNTNVTDDNADDNAPVTDRIEENRREKNRKEEKKIYLDFVFLSDIEHQKLIEHFGEVGTSERIAALNEGIGSKGYKYKSHYHTILSWERMHKEKIAVVVPPAAKTVRFCDCDCGRELTKPSQYAGNAGKFFDQSCRKKKLGW